MKTTHVIKIFVNGSFVFEIEAVEVKTSRESATSFCRVEDDGTLLATHGLVFVDKEEKDVHINVSYDILFVDMRSYEIKEKDGSFYYKCKSNVLGDNVEVFICKDNIFPDYDQCIHDYFKE